MWRPGPSEVWRWASEAQAMLLDGLAWLGLIAVFVVGGLAVLAFVQGTRD